MPFIRKNSGQGSPTSPTTHAIFIGRMKETLFFTQNILKPEEPTHNLLSIWGQAGVGKTTLLHQFISQTRTAEFKDSCLTALVDERQTTPASMMEKFAQQLHLGKPFEKALQHYKETLQFLPLSRSPRSLQEAMITKVPDIASALAEAVTPFGGRLLGEGIKATTEHLLHRHQSRSEHATAILFHDPLDTLTQVFLTELNQLAETKITVPLTRIRRERRILLFFDTFEQVADEAVPWLLHVVLQMGINSNIVFILAGRDPLERSTATPLKQWLPYYENHALYALPVQPFTPEETSAYLAERGITTTERIDTLWRMSHGLPLYLGLLTSNRPESIDPTKDVVDNFLHRIPTNEPTKRQLALDAALFSKPFNQDDLEAFPYLSEEARPTLYSWLLRQPFIHASSLDGRYLYHDLAQELFQRYLFQHSPKVYYATRRTLATYYQDVLEYLQMTQEKMKYGFPSHEQVEVMLALASQRFFELDEESHFQALSPLLDIWDYEDAEQIDAMLRMLQKTVQILSHTQGGSHANLVAQAILGCMETRPTEYDQTDKHQWFEACDQLLMLIKRTSSPELLAKIYHYCGWGYARSKEYQQGLLWFERALQLHPHSALAYNGLGATYNRLKEYQRALDHFTKGIEIAPHYIHLYIGRARAYGRLQAYQQALDDLDHASQLDRRNFLSDNQRGCLYLELKEYRKALASWKHWLEATSGHLRAGGIQFQLGCAHLWLKDLTQATTCFTRSYELVSTQDFFSWAQDSVLWAREWSSLCQTSAGPQTLHHLEAIARGEHYTAYVCQGVIFFLRKEFQQALITLRHATTLHYDIDWHYALWTDFWREWDAHFWLAMVYMALDQEEEARMAIEQALKFEMPPILLKPLSWFERERPELYEKLIKPLLDSYEV